MKKSSIFMATAIALAWTVSSVSALTPIIQPFKDVPVDHWALSDVEWARDNEVVSGYEDHTFQGNNAVTRYEAVKMFSNYEKLRQAESQALKDEIETLKQEVAQLQLEVAADFPVDHSELALGATSYLVCKSAVDNTRIYTTSFPYPPFEGERYDANGDLINEKIEVKDCVRTTQEYYDSKVND